MLRSRYVTWSLFNVAVLEDKPTTFHVREVLAARFIAWRDRPKPTPEPVSEEIAYTCARGM